MLACAIAFTGALKAQTAEEVQTKFNEAAELYNAKNYVDAIALFEEVVEMGQTTDADVEKIVSNARVSASKASYALGGAAAKGKNYDEAIIYFAKCSDFADIDDPLQRNKAENMIAKVYEVQGNTLLAAEDYAGAAAVYMKGVDRNSKNASLSNLAAQCYAKSGDMEKAEELYKGVIELGAKNSKYAAIAEQAKDAYASDMLSNSMEDVKSGKYDDVKVTVEKVFEVAPGNATAYMMLLQAANAAKKYDDVVANGSAAVEAQLTEEGKSNASMLVGAAYQNKGDKAKAIAAYKAVTAGPNVAAAKGAITELSK